MYSVTQNHSCITCVHVHYRLSEIAVTQQITNILVFSFGSVSRRYYAAFERYHTVHVCTLQTRKSHDTTCLLPVPTKPNGNIRHYSIQQFKHTTLLLYLASPIVVFVSTLTQTFFNTVWRSGPWYEPFHWCIVRGWGLCSPK